MSHELYFKSEEDTHERNEIPADIFLVPPPPRLRKNIYQIIEGLLLHTF